MRRYAIAYNDPVLKRTTYISTREPVGSGRTTNPESVHYFEEQAEAEKWLDKHLDGSKKFRVSAIFLLYEVVEVGGNGGE